MKHLIIASSSKRREQILRNHGIKFKISPSNIAEDRFNHLNPIKMVETLSFLKAKKAFEKFPNSIILGADTTVVLGKKILGKPKSSTEAYKMLKSLSGKTHKVITGFTITNSSDGKTLTSHEITKVTFRKLSEEEINNYVGHGEVMDKAGAYAIQEEAGEFVEKIEGDYLNVVGLPSKVFDHLKSFGIA